MLQIVLLLRADALLHDGLAVPIDIGTEPVTLASEETRLEGCEIGANACVQTSTMRISLRERRLENDWYVFAISDAKIRIFQETAKRIAEKVSVGLTICE